jgi:chromosome segregation ATPase
MFWEEKKDVISVQESKDSLREAFARVKKDISCLGSEFYSLKNDFIDLKNSLLIINESIDSLKLEIMDLKDALKKPTHIPTDSLNYQTNLETPTHIPTVPMEERGLKYPNLDISTRNGGVPTDRQTDQQTDIKRSFLIAPSNSNPDSGSEKPLNKHIQEAEDILNSLDALKKEIRLKFKQLTSQEMLIFSTIYQLETEFPEGIEYRQIATKLKLSESSIRDYIKKLTQKGIPIDKIKLNNKKILLKISFKLKNIAPLETLIRLREL